MKHKNDYMVIIATLLFWIMFYLVLNLDILVNVNAIQSKPKGITLVQFEEPCSTSSVKTYMDYHKITSKTSEQYQYIQENMTVIDGYLVSEDNYIGVALGTYFGDIGSKWIFLLDSGIELRLVKVEHKADEHTGHLNCEHKIDRSVIELVIDSSYFKLSSNGFVYNGNFNNIDEFKGNIVGYRKVK